MSKYLGHVLSITPVLANDNCALDAGASESGKIYEFRASGQSTATTAMATRLARTAGDGTVPVAGNVQKRHPTPAATNLIAFVSSWGGQPTLDPGGLLEESWNSFGGIVKWHAGPDEEFIIIGAEQISCRNSVGLGVSTYRMAWEEE